MPKRLHQDFYNVYAFCRWADDLGDEIGDRAESLRLLAWWRTELEAMYQGRVHHPVFVALEGTARKYNLPIQLFSDLISAFEQDQRVARYQNWDELFAYCRCSANPDAAPPNACFPPLPWRPRSAPLPATPDGARSGAAPDQERM